MWNQTSSTPQMTDRVAVGYAGVSMEYLQIILILFTSVKGLISYGQGLIIDGLGAGCFQSEVGRPKALKNFMKTTKKSRWENKNKKNPVYLTHRRETVQKKKLKVHTFTGLKNAGKKLQHDWSGQWPLRGRLHWPACVSRGSHAHGPSSAPPLHIHPTGGVGRNTATLLDASTLAFKDLERTNEKRETGQSCPAGSLPLAVPCLGRNELATFVGRNNKIS